MNDDPDSSPMGNHDLKRQIADAVRAVLREEADKSGMTVEELLDCHFGKNPAEAGAPEH